MSKTENGRRSTDQCKQQILLRCPLPRGSHIYDRADSYHVHIEYIEFARGCTETCTSCAVPFVSGRKTRHKEIERIVEEVSLLRYPMSFITDDVLFMREDQPTKDHVREIFTELGKSEHGHGFYIPSVALLPEDDQFLSTLYRGGARVSYFTLGLDPLSSMVINGKSPRNRKRLIKHIKRIQDAGLLVYAAFHLGSDDDDESIGDTILQFCIDADIKIAQFCMRMPWPGTALWHSLNRQGRIFNKDWSDYNSAKIVFTPKKMSPEKLQDMFVDLWKVYAGRFNLLYKIQRTNVIDYNTL